MKFIHAHQMAKKTMTKLSSVADVALREAVVPAGPQRLRDGDDEDQVEEQLERGRRAVRLVRVPGLHPPVEGHDVGVAHVLDSASGRA